MNLLYIHRKERLRALTYDRAKRTFAHHLTAYQYAEEKQSLQVLPIFILTEKEWEVRGRTEHSVEWHVQATAVDIHEVLNRSEIMAFLFLLPKYFTLVGLSGNFLPDPLLYYMGNAFWISLCKTI